MLKGGERKLSKLLLKEVNEISNDANKKFDEKVKVLYPHSFSERKKKHVQQSNSKYKKSLEERRRRKWLKFRHKAMKVTQRNEVLVSDVVEKALQENQRKRNNVL